MSRIVESIKEMWKGKDDDDNDYRYRYDQRQAPGSNKYYGYPSDASPETRSGYPGEGRSGYPATSVGDGRSGYPATSIGDGRSGYPATSIGDGRSGYPATSIGDGRSGYPATSIGDGRSGYPATSIGDWRSGYPATSIGDGRSGYPANSSGEGRSGYAADGRSGYPATATADGRSGYPATSIGDGRSGYPTNSSGEGRSGYAADGRSGYPATATADGRSGYPANATVGGYRKPFRQALDDDYVRSSYDTRAEARGEYRKPYESSPRGSEYRQPYGISDASPRAGTEYRGSPRVEVPSRVEISPRGEYVRTTQQSPREYRKSAGGSVVELMVPMCCDKCKEKVQEELIEVDGVESIRCDPKNSRVIITGDKYIDIDRCLTKAERAVKKKCELISNQPDVAAKKITSPSGYYEAVEKSGILQPPTVTSRPSPSGRPTLGRLPSFASGKVTQYDGVGPRGQDYEAKDYNGFRRMPSFSKHRHNDAEYISSFDQRPEPSESSRRGFAPIRRMPSFNRHRHNDAEYITADDRDYSPRTFYETGSSYTSTYNDRPSLLSQVSFSKIPVENPNYVKHLADY